MCCSYLILSALASVMGLGALALLTRARAFLIAAGLLAAPAGLADAMFVPEYWTPIHIFGKNLSVEGVLFSFGNGIIIAALPVVFQAQLRFDHSASVLDAAIRCSAPMLVGFLTFLAVWQHGLGSMMIMHAAFFGFAAMFAFLAWTGWFSGIIALSAGLAFTVIYLLQTVFLVWIDPLAQTFWSAETYLGAVPIWPYLPVEEFLWSFLYGALWASLMLYGFRISYKPDARVTTT